MAGSRRPRRGPHAAITAARRVARGVDGAARGDPPGDGARSGLARGVEQVGDLGLVEPLEQLRGGLAAGIGVERMSRGSSRRNEKPRPAVSSWGAGEPQIEKNAVHLRPPHLVEDRVERAEVPLKEPEAGAAPREFGPGGRRVRIEIDSEHLGPRRRPRGWRLRAHRGRRSRRGTARRRAGRARRRRGPEGPLCALRRARCRLLRPPGPPGPARRPVSVPPAPAARASGAPKRTGWRPVERSARGRKPRFRVSQAGPREPREHVVGERRLLEPRPQGLVVPDFEIAAHPTTLTFCTAPNR